MDGSLAKRAGIAQGAAVGGVVHPSGGTTTHSDPDRT